MTDRDKNIAIAQFCGWWFGRWGGTNERDLIPPHQPPGVYSGVKLIPCDDESVPLVHCPYTSDVVPDYCGDLNAIHEVELKLPPNNSMHGRIVFDNILMTICGSHQACVSSTAIQRAEALLKTIGKWKE